MTFVLAVIALAGIVAAVVSAPLRAPQAPVSPTAARRDELEAAREAKLRELRDARLDFRLGKVAESDHRASEAALRAEAVAILRELDELETEHGDS